MVRSPVKTTVLETVMAGTVVAPTSETSAGELRAHRDAEETAQSSAGLPRMNRLQAFRANLGAVHDRAAAKEPIRIAVEIVERCSVV